METNQWATQHETDAWFRLSVYMNNEWTMVDDYDTREAAESAFYAMPYSEVPAGTPYKINKMRGQSGE